MKNKKEKLVVEEEVKLSECPCTNLIQSGGKVYCKECGDEK